MTRSRREAPLSRERRAAPATIALAIPFFCGCFAFIGNTAGEGRGAVTVEGETAWVSQVVIQVFHEVRIPVARADEGNVHSGAFRVQGQWFTGRVVDRVACGPHGDFEPWGEVVELQVDGYVTDASVGQPPGTVQPRPGQVPARETGRRSRVVLNSEGRVVSGAEVRCTLSEAFTNEILDRITRSTGGRNIVADDSGPVGR